MLLIESRKGIGMTQTELAGALDKPQSFVSKYERGERRLDVIEFLEVIDALRLDGSDFIQHLQSLHHGKQASEP